MMLLGFCESGVCEDIHGDVWGDHVVIGSIMGGVHAYYILTTVQFPGPYFALFRKFIKHNYD